MRDDCENDQTCDGIDWSGGAGEDVIELNRILSFRLQSKSQSRTTRF